MTLQTYDWSELWRWQAIIVTKIIYFFEKNEKNEKCLELPNLARKLIRKIPPRHVRQQISAEFVTCITVFVLYSDYGYEISQTQTPPKSPPPRV